MEQEKKVLLTVDTGSSEKTVKSLKKDISDLKDAILNLEKGSDAYNDAVEQLQKNQRELDGVMALTKKTATALDGSYDALVHQMSLLKKEWRATADEAKRASLGKQIDDINAQLKEMDASVGNFQRNVGNYVSHWEGATDVFAALKKEIKDTKNELLQLEEGTEEYNNALVRLGNAQFQLKDMTESAKYSTTDLGEQLDNVTQIAGGVAAGFSALQGIMVLTGQDTENLQETMVRLQAAMAVVQGLKGIEGLGKQLKGLSTAIKAITGISAGWVAVILAVVAGTVALFKNLPIVKEREERWANQMEKTKRIQTDLANAIENGNKKLSNRIEILKAQGVAEKELVSIQMASAKADRDLAKKNYDETLATERRMLEMTEAMTAGAFKQVYGMNKKEAKEFYAERTKEAKETYDKAATLYEGYVQKMKVLDEAEKTAFKERLKSYEEALKSEEQKLKEQYENDLKNAEKYNLDKTVIEKKYQEDLKKLRERYKTTTTTDTKEVKSYTSIINEKIKLEERATDNKLSLLEIEKLKEETIAYETIKDKEKLSERLLEIEREYLDKEYEIQLQLKQFKLDTLKQSLEDFKGTEEERLEIVRQIAEQEIAINLYKEQQKNRQAKNQNTDNQQQQKSTTGTTQSGGKSKTPYTDKIDQMLNEAKTFEDYWDTFKQSFEDFDEIWNEMSFEQKAAQVTNLTSAVLGNTGAILNSLADMYEQEGELSEKEQKKIKNLRIAGATIDMLNGCVSAMAQAMTIPPPLGPILGAINVASMLTLGGINIAKIKNTKVDGSGGGSTTTGAAVPSVSTYSSELPATYVRNVTSASETDLLNQDTRVYILESDIQESNKRVSVRESESSF